MTEQQTNYDDLPPRVAELQRQIDARDNELAAIRAKREDTSAALLAILRPELEKMVQDLVTCGFTYEDLRSRIVDLETKALAMSLEDPSSDIRAEVREMIADGDIVVSLDVM
jgi:predicted  nucleic acid-binding Zn-ribbon protein